nr:Type 1 glutamine amidotransferase-like domain-containing protein [Lachnospiraceae bacterium]
MTLFLTSSFTDRETVGIDPANGFLAELKKRLPRRLKGVFVCSDPEAHDVTDLYGASTADCFKREGFFFTEFTVLDDRNDARAAEIVGGADLVILSGGHVPTQNRYFNRIGLKDVLRDYGGALIGISAGTMNCAGTVYAQPEEEGEAVDPAFQRYLPGLGLTDINVLPHYYDIKDLTLDGLRIMEDVAFPDSFTRPILVLPDGSYVLCEGGREEVRGPAWLLKDGVMTPV